MAKNTKEIAADNWMAGAVLTLASIVMYTLNLSLDTWNLCWLYQLCTFASGAALVLGAIGAKQEYIIWLAKKEAKKNPPSTAPIPSHEEDPHHH